MLGRQVLRRMHALPVHSVRMVVALAALLVAAACERAGFPVERAAVPAVVPTCTEVVTHSEEGRASWYGRAHHGHMTASGAAFSMGAMTAAHPSLPMGTRVTVTNLDNGRAARLTINDRGPFRRGRIVDVSRQAAEELGFRHDGTARVRVEATRPC
jgi:rare lipoprotein A